MKKFKFQVGDVGRVSTSDEVRFVVINVDMLQDLYDVQWLDKINDITRKLYAPTVDNMCELDATYLLKKEFAKDLEEIINE